MPLPPTITPGRNGAFTRGVQDPQMRNLLIAAGNSMSQRNPAAFGQHLQKTMQPQSQQGAFVSKWLEVNGADPSLVQMAAQGDGKQAFEMFHKGRLATKTLGAEPTLVEEHAAAIKGGFQGTLEDWVHTKKNKVPGFTGGIQHGAIPMGQQLRTSPDGELNMSAIPGGPDDLKAKALAAKAALNDANKSYNTDEMLDTMTQFESSIKNEDGVLPTTGFGGQLLSGLGGTAANNAAMLATTMKANIGFDRLDAMRRASPTGGALGQVSKIELEQLNSSIASLEQSQTQEQLLRNLRKVRLHYLRSMYTEKHVAELMGESYNGGSFDMPAQGASRGPARTSASGVGWKVVE